MRRVLITGGSGFVGANLALRLLADGHLVQLLVRPGHDSWRIAPMREDVRLIGADLHDAGSVEQAVRSARPDWIFHLAAFGAYPHQSDLPTIARTNIWGTMHLVEAALKVGFETLANAGSSSEYGYKQHAPGEDEHVDPNSYYAWAKASATMFCRHTASVRDVHIPTLRLYSVYGPYEQPGRLMPALIAAGLRGTLPPLVDPGVARDFVYVDDVVDAFVRVAEHRSAEPGAVYNVGTGTQTTLAQVVEAARRRLGVTGEPHWGSMPRRAWDTDVWVSDSAKIARELGWRPATTLADGFGRFVDWCDANPQVLALYDLAVSTVGPMSGAGRST